ncbi:3-hydroxyacyl-CoA dehydrogenase family protein [Arthrobacter sp. JSM 101049]|uniref:3-hydroxyacyl-CoA dehydrogenase family protein n=1 Tax=Arthrobacter sp. JSM 101049 TaxID=929097 RepID=UPI00356614FA
MDIENLLVIGSGAMGSQIGLVGALAGYDTTIQDVSGTALDKVRAGLRDRMERNVEKNRTPREEADAAWQRIRFSTDLSAVAPRADLVIEAATENLDTKRMIFADLGRLTRSEAILATNSSSIGSSQVAAATGRPDKVCNMHFFNPALVMKCVEVVRHAATSQDTIDTVLEVARAMGKSPVLINREIPGFVANRLMGAIRDEALRLRADGIASFEDIDTAARSALGHPMGPFELMDLVGLDVSYQIRQSTFDETGDPADLPHPDLAAMYERGDFGRKTGKGWYDYSGKA